MRAPTVVRPLTLLLALLAAVGALRLLDTADDEGPPDPGPREEVRPACAPGAPGCESAARGGSGAAAPREPTFTAGEVCRRSGYLCATLRRGDTLRIVRFPDRVEVLTIRVPPPETEDAERARELQRAAIRGIQTWQGHPFPIRIEERSRGEPVDMEVRWVREVGGSILGQTHSRYRSGPGGIEYRVVGLTLATRVPGSSRRVLDPGTLELSAAHEMGHALGLPHSDDSRDLMYPQNTATRPTTRDYRTVEALYRMPNGAAVVDGG